MTRQFSKWRWRPAQRTTAANDLDEVSMLLFSTASRAGTFLERAVRHRLPRAMSLAQAQEIAVRNHPRIASAALTAQAGESAVKEVESAKYPDSLRATSRASGRNTNAAVSAGAVTTSSIYNRAATGVVATQLLTDFGRTTSLEQSAKLRNASQNQNVTNTRAQVLIEVQQAYYQALASRVGPQSRPGDARSSPRDSPSSQCAGPKRAAVDAGRQFCASKCLSGRTRLVSCRKRRKGEPCATLRRDGLRSRPAVFLDR